MDPSLHIGMIQSTLDFGGTFSIGIGLERVGVVGPIRRSCAMRYLQKQQKQGDPVGERRPPLRCLS